MEQGLEKGRPAPDWFYDEPLLYPGDDFFLRAFWDLSTERQLGMSVGPIPWSRIQQYGGHSSVNSDMMVVFTLVVRTMDQGYLEWVAAEQEKMKQRAKSKTPGKRR